MYIESTICTKLCVWCWGHSDKIDIVFTQNLIESAEKSTGWVMKEEGGVTLFWEDLREAANPDLEDGGKLLSAGVTHEDLKNK